MISVVVSCVLDQDRGRRLQVCATLGELATQGMLTSNLNFEQPNKQLVHHMFKQLICILTESRLSPSHHYDMNEKVKALSDPRAIQYLVLSYFV